VIRLLLVMATAGLVVWGVDRFRADAPAAHDEARAALEGAARMVEQAASEARQVLERPPPSAREPEYLEPSAPFAPGNGVRAAVAREASQDVERQASEEVGERVPRDPGFVESVPPEPLRPLDAERAEAVRSRLDRVMSLASGRTR